MSQNNISLNPDKVEELCQEHRWSSKGLFNAQTSKFGTIPELFEKAASEQPEGSKAQLSLKAAFEKASKIYRDQILEDVRNETSGKSRSELEPLNESLFHLSKKYEGQDNYVRGRLLWAAHMVGDWYYKNGGPKGPAMGPGYQQFKLKPR